jgi:hypothetical protein
MLKRTVALSVLVVTVTSCASDPTHSPPLTHATPRASIASRHVHGRFASISDAVAYIATKVDVPVELPTGLPAATKLAPGRSVRVYTRSRGHVDAQLVLRLPGGREIRIDYGVTGLDGCPGPIRPIRIGSHPGLLVGEGGEHPWWWVIWPATVQHPIGRYSISGSISRKRILDLVASMRRVRAVRRNSGGSVPGCP